MLEINSGTASFFSCRYRPGATNAHAWYSTKGIARPIASTRASLNGTVNGATTLVAINVAPAGSFFFKGSATNVNSWFMYIAQGMKQMPTASMALSSRSRSSSRWEISVPSASPPGSPCGSLIG